MMLPPVVRIFFAIALPDSTKKKLGQFISALKKQSDHGIRWTIIENLHITLQFIAEAHAQNLPQLIDNVRSRIRGAISPMTLKWGDLKLFPNPFRPRVIVLEIQTQELVHLSELIGQGMVATHYVIETKPFRAHLTLGRIKQPRNMDLNFLSSFVMPEFEETQVNEVVLYRSEPQPQGSHYTVIEKINLEAAGNE